MAHSLVVCVVQLYQNSFKGIKSYVTRAYGLFRFGVQCIASVAESVEHV